MLKTIKTDYSERVKGSTLGGLNKNEKGKDAARFRLPDFTLPVDSLAGNLYSSGIGLPTKCR
jgi:hypothetical protein